MKHYFDTSVFLKAYVNEAESAMVKTIVEGSEQVVTSVLTYAEMRAALGRQQRNRRLTVDQEEQAAGQLDRDFGTWPLVGLTQVLAHEAGRLAARHALTGADAVHLASALQFAASTGETVIFWSADDRLVRAARREGLRIGRLGPV